MPGTVFTAEMLRITFCIFVSLISLSWEAFASDGWNQVDPQFSYNLMKNINLETHNTKLFRHQPGLYVRHDLHFQVSFQHHKLLCNDKIFNFKLMESNSSVHTWIQRPTHIHPTDEILNFYLHVSRSIPIGQYALSVIDPCSEKELHLCYVNLMFSPWASDRVTEGRIRRQTPSNNSVTNEYVNNNFGYIWIGGRVAIPWNYGINSQVVTDAKNALTQMMSHAERSDPVLYSRTLTQLIGSDVLYGRWDGSYSDGVEPTQWVGSEDILKRWLRARKPVRYAQCWVFAAILTTILRASGIPARTVTNYGSHHDRGLTDDGTAVLRQYDNIVQPDETTWNFHVWSEAWLARPDLGQPIGWNAVDATPQEPSPLEPGQPYRAGPAYVPFIRSDMRNSSYDAYFVLAEVNAVKICPMTGKPLPQAVGYAVLTKKPGTGRDVYNYNNPENITPNYKISSPAFKKTLQASDNAHPILPPPYTGCERDEGMRLDSTPVHPRVGGSFGITVTEGNVSIEDTVIRMELVNYMGESLGIIETFTGMKELNVTEVDYLPYLGNSSIFRFSVGTYNNSGSFVFHDALRVRLEYDQLNVEATRDVNSTTITLVLTYTNPLSAPMTGVIVSVSSPNNNYIRGERPDIPANTNFTSVVKVECYEDDDGDAIYMIPVSLDSDVTQSVYGIGWTSCSDTPSNGGMGVMFSILSELQMLLLSLLSLYLFV